MLSCKKCKCATCLAPGEVSPSQAKGMIGISIGRRVSNTVGLSAAAHYYACREEELSSSIDMTRVTLKVKIR